MAAWIELYVCWTAGSWPNQSDRHVFYFPSGESHGPVSAGDTCAVQSGTRYGRVCAGSLVGIVLGIGMGYSPIVEAIFAPIFRIIRPIPPIAWIPISIIWFGLGESAKVFISAFSNVTLNAWSGAKNIDPALIGAAKMLGANDRQIFLTVIFPGDVPSIFAGLQVAISSCWATVLAAEMVRSSEGLGWLIIAGSSNNDMVQVMVGIVCIGIVGLCLAILFRKMEEVLCRWNRSEQ